MTLDDLLPPDADQKAKELLHNPVFLMMTGLVVLKVLSSPTAVPKWLKDAPPIHARVAGPWRGKGSFGHGFGPQARHK